MGEERGVATVSKSVKTANTRRGGEQIVVLRGAVGLWAMCVGLGCLR